MHKHLLHSQSGFAITPGWNRLLLDTPQAFSEAATRVLALEITTPTDGFQITLDASIQGSTNSFASPTGVGAYASITYPLTQSVLLSGAACEPPSFTVQPAGSSICVGDDYTFTPTATGPGISYRWQRMGWILTVSSIQPLPLPMPLPLMPEPILLSSPTTVKLSAQQTQS